jgi:hypothetical protein
MHRLRFLLAVLAGAAIAAGLGASGASAKAKPKPKSPTKLWYRVFMSYQGETSRTIDGNRGPLVNKGRWQWIMESRNAVIVSRGAGKRADISFSAAMEGELLGYSFSTTFGRPDGPIAGGRYRDCERETRLYKINGLKLFDGGVSAAPASKGIDVRVAMNPLPEDATVVGPTAPVKCTREDYDLVNPPAFLNQRPFTIPAGEPSPTVLTDLDQGRDAAYSAGSQPTGVLTVRPGVRFGGTISKSINVQREVTTVGGLPPVEVTERYTLQLRPCPRGGRDVKRCVGRTK